ncbi:MAG: DNA-binding protein [Candidatus Methanoperedens sp.]|nr:MAG: DNA-binding protein [Candidatus Methanoperedens sp.]
MDKILDREVAWRVFAWEFNRSTLHFSEGDERAPNYIITPTGVKCNRLFIVGVVTEVENIGKDNSLWRGRVADPTGVFTVYAGHYQPEAAIFLSELNIPAYVAVVGKARKFEPEDGSVYTSVRPEEINNADEKLRDRWVLDTAERTLERIKYIEDALSSGKSGNDLKEYLLVNGTNSVLADGAVKAIEHYKNLDKTISELKNAVIHAIEAVASDRETKVQNVEKREETITVEENAKPELKEPETGPKEIIAGIIDKLDTGKGISYSIVVETAHKAGIDPETVESGIKELMDEGRCYEPKIGVLRKV